MFIVKKFTTKDMVKSWFLVYTIGVAERQKHFDNRTGPFPRRAVLRRHEGTIPLNLYSVIQGLPVRASTAWGESVRI